MLGENLSMVFPIMLDINRAVQPQIDIEIYFSSNSTCIHVTYQRLEISDLGSREIILSMWRKEALISCAGYHAADLRLCFHICKKQVFS